ncbi:MAG: hypothetical protein ABJQ71_13625 [Roseibium sp.]
MAITKAPIEALCSPDNLFIWPLSCAEIVDAIRSLYGKQSSIFSSSSFALSHQLLLDSEVLAQRKVNPMSKVIDMADTSAAKRRPKPSRGSENAQADHNANFAYRLFLVVDLAVYDLIVWLKDVLEAPSFGDVVRQAVRAYAIELAKTGRITDAVCELPVDSDPSGKLKKLNIRIPSRTKARLDMLKARTGATFTDIIVCGLGILARTAEEQEAILTNLDEGGELDATNPTYSHATNQGHSNARGRMDDNVGSEAIEHAKRVAG